MYNILVTASYAEEVKISQNEKSRMIDTLLSLPDKLCYESTPDSFKKTITNGKFWKGDEAGISYLLIEGDGCFGERLFILHKDKTLYMIMSETGEEKNELQIYQLSTKDHKYIGSIPFSSKINISAKEAMELYTKTQTEEEEKKREKEKKEVDWEEQQRNDHTLSMWYMNQIGAGLALGVYDKYDFSKTNGYFDIMKIQKMEITKKFKDGKIINGEENAVKRWAKEEIEALSILSYEKEKFSPNMDIYNISNLLNLLDSQEKYLIKWDDWNKKREEKESKLNVYTLRNWVLDQIRIASDIGIGEFPLETIYKCPLDFIEIQRKGIKNIYNKKDQKENIKKWIKTQKDALFTLTKNKEVLSKKIDPHNLKDLLYLLDEQEKFFKKQISIPTFIRRTPYPK